MYIPSVNLHNIAIEDDTFTDDVSDYLPTQNGDFPGLATWHFTGWHKTRQLGPATRTPGMMEATGDIGREAPYGPLMDGCGKAFPPGDQNLQ